MQVEIIQYGILKKNIEVRVKYTLFVKTIFKFS